MDDDSPPRNPKKGHRREPAQPLERYVVQGKGSGLPHQRSTKRSLQALVSGDLFRDPGDTPPGSATNSIRSDGRPDPWHGEFSWSPGPSSPVGSGFGSNSSLIDLDLGFSSPVRQEMIILPSSGGERDDSDSLIDLDLAVPSPVRPKSIRVPEIPARLPIPNMKGSSLPRGMKGTPASIPNAKFSSLPRGWKEPPARTLRDDESGNGDSVYVSAVSSPVRILSRKEQREAKLKDAASARMRRIKDAAKLSPSLRIKADNLARPRRDAPRPDAPRRDEFNTSFDKYLSRDIIRMFVYGLIPQILICCCLVWYGLKVGMSIKPWMDARSEVSNIAIIGAGPAGISTAYHISKLAQERNLKVSITIFERKAVIGGRLAVEPFEKTSKTSYWSLLSDQDDWSFLPDQDDGGFGTLDMRDPVTLKEIKISMEDMAGAPLVAPSRTLLDIALDLDMNVGVDKENFTTHQFRESIKLAADRSQTSIPLASGFERLSELMHSKFASGGSFASLDKLPKEWEIFQNLQHFPPSVLSEWGNVPSSYMAQVFEMSIHRFGCIPDTLNWLELSMAIYESEYSNTQVGGLLKPLLDEMLKVSNAEVRLLTDVVSMFKWNGWSISSRPSNIDPETNYDSIGTEPWERFDKVILAAPFMPPELDIWDHRGDPTEYIRLQRSEYMQDRQIRFSGLPDGSILGEKLNYRSEALRIPESRSSSAATRFDLATRIRPILMRKGPGNLWKVVSTGRPFVYKHFGYIFGLTRRFWVRQVKHLYGWTRYASEDRFGKPLMSPIQLDDTMWHTAPIEAIGSSVELAAFNGRNVARLVLNQWTRELGIFEKFLVTFRSLWQRDFWRRRGSLKEIWKSGP